MFSDLDVPCVTVNDGQELVAFDIARVLQSNNGVTVCVARVKLPSLRISLPPSGLLALKVVDKDALSANNALRLIWEVRVHATVGSHPNIVSLHQIIMSRRRLVMVMDFCDGGDLHTYLKARQTRRLELDEAKSVARQLVSALRHMHECGYVHRDVKLENVLVDSTGIVQLCDFGFSVPWSNGNYHREALGTLCYASPEIFRGKYVGPEVDVWSLGVTLFITLIGSLPFYAEAQRDTVNMIFGGFHDDIVPPNVLADRPAERGLLVDLLRGMLHAEASTRLTLGQVEAHPFFAEG